MNFLQTIKMKRIIEAAAPVLIFLIALATSKTFGQSMADYTMQPPLSEKTNVNPMVMLTLSGDHQLFLKAYNDYDDLDGDGVPDTTYNRNFAYMGYFDFRKCYLYNNASGYFEPTASAPTNDPVNGVTLNQYCPDAEWSGNFLNWATMTRIDIIRHVLYGGFRSVDTATETILERSYLPNDAHSFAKYLVGNDIHKLTAYANDTNTLAGCGNDANCKMNLGITFCNTTFNNAAGIRSQAVSSPPLMRVVRGNYSLWATSERYQCLLGVDGQPREFDVYGGGPFGKNGNDPVNTGIFAHNQNPPVSALIKDYTVRVKACGPNSDGGANECKTYGSSKKPVGLIQNYGEERNVDFGLMTRAFNRNKSAGALRKNIGAIADEIDPTNGTFLDAAGGSIISSLDALRLVDYMFKGPGISGDDYYNVGTYNITCPWHTDQFTEGTQCKNWGNPFNELMAESYRYFSASDPSVTGEPDAITPPLLGLTTAAWSDPLASKTDASCVNFNVIGFNASAVSFDSETAFGSATPTSMGIGSGSQSLREMTNQLGAYELSPAQKYFIGRSGTEVDGQCTPKTITNFGEVSGTCPDAPRLEGSYLMAGLSHFVRTNDVRPDRPDQQFNINTYGVTMAGNLPTINVPVPGVSGRSIDIIPACRNKADSDGAPMPVGNCALIDFKPVPGAAGQPITKYFVAWEDTEHGSDYDQDLNGVIEYAVTSGSISVSTTIFGESTDNEIDFGFVISGTGTPADDGIHFPSYINKNRNPNNDDKARKTLTFTINSMGTSSAEAKFLDTPLYYATKWGSFKDINGNGRPDLDAEWKGTDGLPTGYALVRKPNALKDRLEGVLDSLVNNASTGTSASIESSRLAGEGLMLQTLYNPEIKSNTQAVSWVGTLNGLFIDANGNIREDNGDKALDGEDYLVEFISDPDADDGKTLRFNSYPVNAAGEPLRSSPSARLNQDLENLGTLWNARDALAAISSANIVQQRGTTELADAKRFILTAVDQPNAEGARDGQLTNAEVIPFVASNVATNNLTPLLDVTSASEAESIVNYIRGLEIDGYRPRSINIRGDEKVWRLGDIVHSTPSIVGRPSDGYDAIYGDDSYLEFRDQYRERRTMVYVGANDGMLHAFNAGFFRELDDNSDGVVDSYAWSTNGGTGKKAHGLGTEMWAYVPYNLLPHLKWLADPAYSHVYYVDSKVYTFDVNIFDDDAVHPNGWGTILVVGMRFGGGEYEVELDNGAGLHTMRSAYIIMDITDPERPPELIAEITDPALGFTTGDVEVVHARAPASNGSYLNSTQKNEWGLLFGSGPRGDYALSDAISDQPAKLFHLNLKNAVDGQLALTLINLDDTARKSFVSAIKAVDWNRDYSDDMLYLGVLGDHGRRQTAVPDSPAPAPYHGSLKHLSVDTEGSSIDFGDVDDLLTGTGTNLPYSATPLTIRDRDNNYWVFTGTGRFLVKQDLEIDVENKYFGIRVNNPEYNPNDASPESRWLTDDSVNINRLYDVSNDQLFVNQYDAVKVRNTDAGTTKDIGDYLRDISEHTPAYAGWYRELIGVDATNFTRTAFINETLAFNSYSPDQVSCAQRGTSNLYLLDMFTGLPQYDLVNIFQNSDGTTTDIGGQQHKEIGAVAGQLEGVASDPAIINNHVITQSDKGQIANQTVDKPSIPVRRSWREIPLDELN